MRAVAEAARRDSTFYHEDLAQHKYEKYDARGPLAPPVPLGRGGQDWHTDFFVHDDSSSSSKNEEDARINSSTEHVYNDLSIFTQVPVKSNGHCFRHCLSYHVYNKNKNKHDQVLRDLIRAADALTGDDRNQFVEMLCLDFYVDLTRADTQYCVSKCATNYIFYQHFTRKYLKHWSTEASAKLTKHAYPS